VATAFGPVPPPPPEETGAFSQAGTGLGLVSSLVLKLSPVGQRLALKLSLSTCLPAFRRSFAVLAIALPFALGEELDVSQAGQLEADG